MLPRSQRLSLLVVTLLASMTQAVPAIAAQDLPPLDSGSPAVAQFSQTISSASMSGFLLGVDPGDPPPAPLVSALAPALWRGTDASLMYASKVGAAYELVTSFLWNPPGAGAPHAAFGDDPTHPDWSAYDQFLTQLARKYKDEVKYWEFWNEPDFDHFWPHATHQDTRCQEPLEIDPLRDRLFEAYGHFVRVMRRELGSEARLVAPSLAAYCEPFLRAFLQYAAAHQLDVNVLTWHELRDSQDTLPAIVDHLRQARREFFYDPKRPETAPYRDLHLQALHINESVGPDHNFHPGDLAAYLYFMEQGSADGAVRACWPDEAGPNEPRSNGCNNNTIDGLLTPAAGAASGAARQPRASWWVYAQYAQVRDRRVTCGHWKDAVCLAGINEAGIATVIVGRYGAMSPPERLTLRLEDLRSVSTLAEATRVRVVVSRLPVGPAPLPQLSDELSMEVPIHSNQANITLPPLDVHEALLLRLERGH